MRYKVVAYLKTYNDSFDKPVKRISYKLKKIGWLGVWYTINKGDNEAILQKQADELTLNFLKNQ